jgi:enamine deaminase RidA (YjgF/YER057c/UK114 family)
MGSRGEYRESSGRGGIEVCCLERRGLREVFATALPRASGELPALLRELKRLLDGLEAEILEMRVFAESDTYRDFNQALMGRFGHLDWPVTYVYGDSCAGGRFAGVQTHAVSGVPVAPVSLGGTCIGRVFEDDYARYCVLGNLQSAAGLTSREAQTRDTFENMEKGLEVAGMDLSSLVRTWFFINDILEWYSDFNAVRTETYAARGMFERYVPASTGIGGGNPGNVAVVASALAMQAKGDYVVIKEIPSPLQCPARDYGSSFSRAAEISSPDVRSVLVSGTASIDQDGSTVHSGDLHAQVSHTLDVVQAILRSRGMDFADVTRGNAYFKHPRDSEVLNSYGGRYGLPEGRIVVSHADICRDDLLFEIELDAAKPEKPSGQAAMSGRAKEAKPAGSVR